MSPLRNKIEEEIRKRGPIPFSRYMELCLCDAEFGYYSRDAEQFGKAGDFYTASDVHALFGRLLARQFEEMWRVLGSPEEIELVELGPGRGLFAQDCLDWAERKFPGFFRALHYVLVEKSASLRARLESALKRYLAAGKACVTAATAWETGTARVASSNVFPASKTGAPRIVFANEFFDALPVEILSTQGSLRVDVRENRFVEAWAESSPEELECLDRYSVHPEPGERVEVPLIAQRYMSSLASHIQRGFAVIIDYGYTREEQLAGRHRGTLKAIRQHAISANPYEAPGEQDITADVNFTGLAALAGKHGMQTHKLLTQSQFLLGIAETTQFGDAFAECALPQERAKRALQLKHLITPAGMGESFHVLVGSKGIETGWEKSLTGLNFARGR